MIDISLSLAEQSRVISCLITEFQRLQKLHDVAMTEELKAMYQTELNIVGEALTKVYRSDEWRMHVE